MVTHTYKTRTNTNTRGFTLVEIMIVVAILGILAAIAYPNYQKSVIKTKRTDMMTTLQSIASDLQAQKMGKGSYNAFAPTDINNIINGYATQSTAKLYTITINLDSNGDGTLGDWLITATPKASSDAQIQADGVLTLDANGIKCRATKCGTSDEWNS